MDTVIIVMTTMPDEDSANALIQQILQTRLAACINRLAPCKSRYYWEGQIETANEWPLLIKTSAARYPALEQCIQANHPYAVPEIIGWPAATGSPAYLQWILQETRETPDV